MRGRDSGRRTRGPNAQLDHVVYIEAERPTTIDNKHLLPDHDSSVTRLKLSIQSNRRPFIRERHMHNVLAVGGHNPDPKLMVFLQTMCAKCRPHGITNLRQLL